MSVVRAVYRLRINKIVQSVERQIGAKFSGALLLQYEENSEKPSSYMTLHLFPFQIF
jgi:hypothetical protein